MSHSRQKRTSRAQTEELDAAALPRRLELTRLLGRCLAFGLDHAGIHSTRALLTGCRWDALFELADEVRLGPALAEAVREKRLIPPVLSGVPGTGRIPVAIAIEQRLLAHRERRRILADRLLELVRALNDADIEPILLKGARSLWSGVPAWRTLRDIDLLVSSTEAERAQAIALDLGYAQLTILADRPRRHHLAPLFRTDLPGWLEIHRRGANRYAEALLPTSELERTTRSAPLAGGGTIRLLSPAMHVLHALVHHHVGHSAFARGTLDIKGLYEFAWDIAALPPAERQEIVTRAEKDPRLLAALDLWIAAAMDLFALPIDAPFVATSDALRRWHRVLARLCVAPPRARLKKYPGYGEEIRSAWNRARLGRTAGGRRWSRRQLRRIAVLLSMLPKLPD